MRLSLTALVVLLVLAATAAAQTASPVLDRAGKALGSDAVYVDPAAEAALTDAQADALRKRLRTSDTGRFFIAVLPESARQEADGTARGALDALRSKVGEPGTYVAVTGHNLIAGSDTLPVGSIADRAVRQQGSRGLPAILDAVIAGVEEARSGARGGSRSGTGSDDGGGGAIGLIVLGVVVVGGAALAIRGVSRRRRREAEELDEIKDQVRDELVELGDGIRALDVDIEMPGVSETARADYERALHAYEKGDQAWELARRPEDLTSVGSSLEEGRWALASARARLEGNAPPERRAPCFFDPRHGPSVRDVEWAPPGGAPRLVPACAADALAVEHGEDPGFREVGVGGRRVPYWQAGPAYSPFYAGGTFGGFGPGLLGGLVLADLFTGPDTAWGGDFGGGDLGGGDFADAGGGDFGGGDFGGGDFGGGDFGGGDFG